MKNYLFVLLLVMVSYSIKAQITKIVNVTTAGTLSTILTDTEKATITDLTVTGNIDARDVKCMRDEITNLSKLDLSAVNIMPFTGSGGTHTYISYPANEFPIWAFYSNSSWIPSKISLETVVLPINLTSIGEFAFSGCTGLTSIIIPNSVTLIKFAAFMGCSRLRNLTLGNSLTTIGPAAFRECSSLARLDLPSSLRTLGPSSFSYCYNLSGNITIGNSVDTIGSAAFNRCSKLNSVTISNSVKIIEDDAFRECNSLTNIVIPESVIKIGNNVFYYCTGLTNVTLGNSIISIGSSCFRFCDKLGSIVIPNSVLSIENDTFWGCHALAQLQLSNSIQKIGNNAFSECWALNNILLPNSLTSIGSNAFYNCKNITEILIPKSVTSIWSAAFCGCTSATKLTIPSSVKYIGSEAFWGAKLANIYIYATTPIDIGSKYGVFLEAIKPTCILHVPAGSLSAYQTALGWREFNIISEFTTGIQTQNTGSISILPNPVKNNFQITGLNGLSKIRITNMNSDIVMSREVNANENISINNLSSGIYLVTIYTKSGVTVRKFIKM
jgi:hypothetical protein